MTKRDQTKTFIIEKSAPIFNQKGYAATSLSDITLATHLTKGSIYGNFEDKDAIAVAAFEYNLSKVNEILDKEISAGVTVRSKLIAYCKVYANYHNYPLPTGGCPILNTAIEADDTHPVLKQKVVAAINSWKKKIISLLNAGINNKEFSKEINKDQIALTIIAIIEGAIMISRTTGKKTDRLLIMKSLDEFINAIE